MNAGIYNNISSSEYHADKSSYSSSTIKLMNVPFVANYSINNPSEYKECYRLGSAIHKYVLEYNRFQDEFLIGVKARRAGAGNLLEWNSWFKLNGATDAESITRLNAGEWNKEFNRQSGRHIVTQEEIDDIKSMSEAVFSNKSARKLLENGIAESSIYWKDEEYGLSLRCRPDYLGVCCSDLKSIKAVDDRTIEYQVDNLNYSISAAMYMDGVRAVTGNFKPFTFIFISKSKPYICRVKVLDDDRIEDGWTTYRENIQSLASCLESGEWPGYSEEIEATNPRKCKI